MKFTGRLGYRGRVQMPVLQLLILLVLEHQEGQSPVELVLQVVHLALEPALEPDDLEPEYGSGYRMYPHKYQHRVHAACSSLRRDGYIPSSAHSERGVWQLTRKGENRAQTLLDKGRDPETQITLAELEENLDLSFLDGRVISIPAHETTASAPIRRARLRRKNISEPNSESRQGQILAEEIAHIREFLNGNGIFRPDDQTLCDWVWFCYKFELYAEGATFFSLIHFESVDRWLYEHTKRLAEVCDLRR